MIANLAVFFALHALWSAGLGAPVDVFALAVMLAAAVALIVFKQSTLRVLGACVLAGPGWVWVQS